MWERAIAEKSTDLIIINLFPLLCCGVNHDKEKIKLACASQSADLTSFPGSPLTPTERGEPGNKVSAHVLPDSFSHGRMPS